MAQRSEPGWLRRRLIAQEAECACVTRLRRAVVAGDWPSSSGSALKLSSPELAAMGCPVIAAQVAIRSVRHSNAFEVEPGRMRPGQRARNGTRLPPSHTSALFPLNGPLERWPAANAF